MDRPRSPEVEAFWQAFRCARGVPEQDYDVGRMGDRPRRDWLSSHVAYFSTRRAARDGFAFDEAMPAVFERFTLVWPASGADPEGAT